MELLLAPLAKTILGSVWTYILGGIIAAIGASYAWYKHYQHIKQQKAKIKAEFEVEKLKLERKHREEIEKDIDDPYSHLADT